MCWLSSSGKGIADTKFLKVQEVKSKKGFCRQLENGAEVVAQLLIELACKKQENEATFSLRTHTRHSLQRATSSLGSTRLKDAIVYGYIMQRHAKQERVSPLNLSKHHCCAFCFLPRY